MDIFVIILIIVIFCIFFSICGWCCKRKTEGTVYGFGSLSQPGNATQSPQVMPPYPVHTTPGIGSDVVVGPPYPSHAPYPTNPPAGGPVPFVPPGTAPSYPRTAPYPISNPPYPPADIGMIPPHQQLPPSYYEAVLQPPAAPPPANEVYGKQAPYNPNY